MKKILNFSLIILGILILSFSFSKYSNAQLSPVCKVTSASFIPAGEINYDDANRPTIQLSIQTENCDGKKLDVSIIEKDVTEEATLAGISLFDNIDDAVDGFDNSMFEVPSTELLVISFKPGEDECEPVIKVNTLTGHEQDCKLYIEVNTPDASFKFGKSEYNGLLSYECTLVCDDDFEFIGISGGNVITEWSFMGTGPNDQHGPFPTLSECTQKRELFNNAQVAAGQPKSAGKCYFKISAVPYPPPPVVFTPGTSSYDNTYELLAPIPGLVPNNVVGPDFKLGNYVNNMIKIIIGLGAVLAVVMIVFGGIQWMMSDSPMAIGDGKKRIGDAITGLLLALGSYLILSTINPDLVNINFGLEKQTININPAFVDKDTPHASDNGKFCAGTYPENSTWDPPSDSSTRTQLTSINVPVNKNNCSTVGQQNCTSVKDLNLDYVNKLKALCPSCAVTVTGGTECWLHSSKTLHLPGNPTIDVRKTPEILNVLKDKGKVLNLKGWGTGYEIDGLWYVDEGDHIHIQRPRQ